MRDRSVPLRRAGGATRRDRRCTRRAAHGTPVGHRSAAGCRARRRAGPVGCDRLPAAGRPERWPNPAALARPAGRTSGRLRRFGRLRRERGVRDDAAPVRPGRVARLRSRAWGRFAELWVPESLTDARVDPGRRGAVVLLIIATLAAIVTAVGVWRDRPQARPVESVSIAAAASPGGAAPSAATPAGSAASPMSPSAGPARRRSRAVRYRRPPYCRPRSARRPARGPIVVSVTGEVVTPGTGDAAVRRSGHGRDRRGGRPDAATRTTPGLNLADAAGGRGVDRGRRHGRARRARRGQRSRGHGGRQRRRRGRSRVRAWST